MTRLVERVGQVMDISKKNYFGFFDWFCKTEGLENRAKKLVPKLVKVIEANRVGKRFDESKVHVIFKNNCPMLGDLYDDFRIIDNETEAVIFTVTPKLGYDNRNGESELWGKFNKFDGPMIATADFNHIVDYFRGDVPPMTKEQVDTYYEWED